LVNQYIRAKSTNKMPSKTEIQIRTFLFIFF
jgi:hypothetical protein